MAPDGKGPSRTPAGVVALRRGRFAKANAASRMPARAAAGAFAQQAPSTTRSTTPHWWAQSTQPREGMRSAGPSPQRWARTSGPRRVGGQAVDLDLDVDVDLVLDREGGRTTTTSTTTSRRDRAAGSGEWRGGRNGWGRGC